MTDRMQRAKQIAMKALQDRGAIITPDKLADNSVIVQAAYRALAFDPVQMVEDFHRHFEIHYDGKPRVLDFETSHFRLKFEREEIIEWETHDDGARFELHARAAGSPPDDADLVHHLEGMLDALVDAVYVLLGTAHLQGFDFREAFLRVHKANMAKAKNPDARNANDQIKMKIIKPAGWEPPSHTSLVEDHSHRSIK